MKILWRDPENPNFCIAIQDERNYSHARLKNKGWESFQWFNSIEAAVKRVCKSKADERCTDLSDWLFRYNEMLDTFSALLSSTQCSNSGLKGGRSEGKAINSPNTTSASSSSPCVVTPSESQGVENA